MDSLESLSTSALIGHYSWKVLWTALSVRTMLINVFAVLPSPLSPCLGVHWRTPFMSSSLLPQHVLFVLLEWFVWWEVSGRTICFVQFKCCFQGLFKTAYNIILSFSSSFFPGVSLKSMWCNHTVVLTLLKLWRIPVLFYQRDQIYIGL